MWFFGLWKYSSPKHNRVRVLDAEYNRFKYVFPRIHSLYEEYSRQES